MFALMDGRQNAIKVSKDRMSFLSLPAELRTRIYELVTIPQSDRETNYETGYTFRKQPAIRIGCRNILGSASRHMQNTPAGRNCRGWALQPSITRISRQVRTESLPVYYGANEFFFEPYDRKENANTPVEFPYVQRWLKAIGPENRNLLKTVSIRGGSLNYRWYSARRFVALMAKRGIDLPDNVVSSFHLTRENDFGRCDMVWVKATSDLESSHSDFGDYPEII